MRQPGERCTVTNQNWVCRLIAESRDRIGSGASIHGQFPASVWAKPKDAENGASTPRWCIRIVPKSFTVVPPIGPAAVPLQLSCNYSFLSAVAGIFQVLSGSMALYQASERQIPNFGYAAYSLTVVPYIFMSVVNLVGCMCQPQYPALFLVRYCGPTAPAEISTDDDQVRLLPLREDGTEHPSESLSWEEPELGGAVGTAYGDLAGIADLDTNLFSVGQSTRWCASAKIHSFTITRSSWWSGPRRML